MSKDNIRGILLSVLIGALMAAGVLTAGNAKADSQQDYEYLQILESQGFHVTNPGIAKDNARIICSQLASGRYWKLIVTDIMTETDSDVQSAVVQFAAAVTVYCPSLDPLPTAGGQTA